MNNAFYNLFLSENFRILKLIFIAGSLSTPILNSHPNRNYNDDLFEFFNDVTVQELNEIFQLNSAINDINDIDECENILIENKKFGFLIKLCKILPDSGFGYYETKWVYSDVFEDALSQGFIWSDQFTNDKNVI